MWTRLTLHLGHTSFLVKQHSPLVLDSVTSASHTEQARSDTAAGFAMSDWDLGSPIGSHYPSQGSGTDSGLLKGSQ